MRPLQTMLKPLYDEMQMWIEPARRNASAGIQAVKSIVEGPSFMSASVAEKGLGGLKELAREARTEATRNTSQGIAARATTHLQQAVDEAVARAPVGAEEALNELRAGRRLTALKYGTDEIAKKLRAEPVEMFGQMTYAKDAGVGLLRKVAKEAPEEMPKIGRAWLDEVSEQINNTGGVSKGVLGKWQNLGPQTKRLLFGDRVGALDQYFIRARQHAENPLRKQLSREPVNLYGELVHPSDASINFTRNMARQQSPAEMAKAGRAYIETLFRDATAEGSFNLNRAAGMWEKWKDLGAETKKELFPNPHHRADLDKFFLGIRELGKNPNPSGSALVGGIGMEGTLWVSAVSSAVATRNAAAALVAPAYSLTMKGVSKMLHSPKGVRLLTEGMRVPISNRARAAAISSQILRMAGEDVERVDSGR